MEGGEGEANTTQAPDQAGRFWDQKFNKWIAGEGEKPGAHPDPNHLWNKDEEAFIESKAPGDDN